MKFTHDGGLTQRSTRESIPSFQAFLCSDDKLNVAFEPGGGKSIEEERRTMLNNSITLGLYEYND